MDTNEWVERRIALARQRDARTHGMHFADSLKAFTELFGEAVTQQARERAPPTPDTGPHACPVADLLLLCDAGAQAAVRLRGAGYSEVLGRVGELCWREYFHSPLGKALWQFSGREPHEALSRSASSSRASTNYGVRRYERLGPTQARIVSREEYMGPAWIRGFYSFGLQYLAQHAVSVAVEECREPGLDFYMDITW